MGDPGHGCGRVRSAGRSGAPCRPCCETRFNAQETLTTLMLTYVATFILSYMMHGPWRDPEGMNFPQSIMFKRQRAVFDFGSKARASIPRST